MISVLHWDSSARTCHQTSIDRLPATTAAVAPEDVWWIDLSNSTSEEEELIFGKFFPVHTLTREDITLVRTAPDQGSHLPKVEEFPDYLFVIVNPLRRGWARRSRPSAWRPAPVAAAMLARRTGRS